MSKRSLSPPINLSDPETDIHILHTPLRIVVVDDSADFLAVICELLRSLSSVEIVGAGADGFDALELAGTAKPDLLLMDVNMPGLDGIEAANIIASCFLMIRILLMSADASDEMQNRCRKSRAHGFISKHELTSKLQTLLSRPSEHVL